MATFLFRSAAHDYVVALHTDVSPTAEEWNRYVDVAAGYCRDHGAERLRGITVTCGGAPNAQQRRQLVRALPPGTRSSGAVITPSRWVAGVVRAFAWLSDLELRPFHPSHATDAFAHVKLSSADVQRFFAEAEPHRRQLAFDPLAMIATSGPPRRPPAGEQTAARGGPPSARAGAATRAAPGARRVA